MSLCVCGGIQGLDLSEHAQKHPGGGTLREEGDRRRLKQCVFVYGQT